MQRVARGYLLFISFFDGVPGLPNAVAAVFASLTLLKSASDPGSS
jgi:hypothetical protein